MISKVYGQAVTKPPIKIVLEWEDQNGGPWDLVILFTDHAQQRMFERIIGYALIKRAFELTVDELYDVPDKYGVKQEVLLRWRQQNVSVVVVVNGFDESNRLELAVKTVINDFKRHGHPGDVIFNIR